MQIKLTLMQLSSIILLYFFAGGASQAVEQVNAGCIVVIDDASNEPRVETIRLVLGSVGKMTSLIVRQQSMSEDGIAALAGQLRAFNPQAVVVHLSAFFGPPGDDVAENRRMGRFLQMVEADQDTNPAIVVYSQAGSADLTVGLMKSLMAPITSPVGPPMKTIDVLTAEPFVQARDFLLQKHIDAACANWTPPAG